MVAKSNPVRQPLTTTDMKYSILGFSQEKVVEIGKMAVVNNKEKFCKVDVTDLLILREVADFMNRKKIIKYTIDDKIYFSIRYEAIIKDLPILNIKKQALRDRIDKLCVLGLLEKSVVSTSVGNITAFRLGDLYENLLYSAGGGVCTPLHRGVYSTTQGCVAEYTMPIEEYNIYNNTTTNTNTTKNIKEYKEKFFTFVDLYKKLTGTRTRGKETEFKDFSTRHKNWMDIVPYLPIAIQRETNDRERAKSEGKFFPAPKLLQTYLGKQKAWEMYVTVGEDISDIDNEYHPVTGGNFVWNDYYQKYIYLGMVESMLHDGYTDDNRPDGALVMFASRGDYVWNAELKKWIKK